MGAWNVAILNPQWVAKNIFETKEGTHIPTEISIGTTANFRYQIENLYFLPAPDKLIINPVKEDDKTIKHIDKACLDLFELLPHTPITAIGNNYAYKLEENENFSLDINFETSNLKETYEIIETVPSTSSSLKHSLTLNDDSDVILNLSYKISEKQKEIHMNYHYQVDNKTEKIKHALCMFHKNYQHAKLIESKLIIKETR